MPHLTVSACVCVVCVMSEQNDGKETEFSWRL